MARRLACWALIAWCVPMAVLARRLGAGEADPPAPDGLVGVTIEDVKLDQETQAPLVVLVTAKRDRALLILIGHAEGIAILQRLRQAPPPPRPMTHDLLKSVISRLGGKLRRIAITKLEGGTFHAELVVQHGEATIRIDSRPSDAMALALRTGASVFVARRVLDEAGIDPGQLPDADRPRPPRERPLDPKRTL